VIPVSSPEAAAAATAAALALSVESGNVKGLVNHQPKGSDPATAQEYRVRYVNTQAIHWCLCLRDHFDRLLVVWVYFD